MKIGEMDFPEPLLSALRSGELVVFAGAGVSMGSPACLPSFEGLASRIATHTGRKPKENEPIDAFLGRLDQDGPEVHKRAARELTGVEPTDLHRGLLRLYRSTGAARVVTTNFDSLFEAAAADVFDATPQVFRAPALPLGNDFSGVVHVHGSVQAPRQMVLTDADFGRAYLTEGWARRFVVELFQKHTVLFVGYGHRDVVLNYLSRALPPAAADRRYALVGEKSGDMAHWDQLRVKRILYPQPIKGDHRALPRSLQVLGELLHCGVLEWRSKLRELATGSPPLDAESNDLMVHAFEKPENVRFFTESAESAEWVSWLEARGFLAGLFDDSKYGEREDRLSHWLIWRFAAGEPDVVLDLIFRNGNRLAARFWLRLVAWLDQADGPPIADRLVSVWISLLLENVPRFGPDGGWFHSLAETCVRHTRWHDLVATFERPLVRNLASLRGEAGADAFWLAELWSKKLQPHLRHVADQLLECLAKCLEQRQHLLEIWQPERDGRDWEVLGRLAIESDEGDGCHDHRDPVDTAIDAARDSLVWLAEHREEDAAYWCRRLIRSRSTALRRLAVHAVSALPQLSADERIDWLLTHTDLYELGPQHELFRVAEAAYEAASDERRQSFVDRILGFGPEKAGAEEAEKTARRKFKWLARLGCAAPECPQIKSALSDLRRRYPHLESGGHSDPARSRSEDGTVESSRLLSAAEMLRREPGEWVALLPADLVETYQDANGRWIDLGGTLAYEIGVAARENVRWGLGLADALLAAERLERELWVELLSALAAASEKADVEDVLSLFSRSALHDGFCREIAKALSSAVADQRRGWTCDVLPNVLRVANGLMEAARRHGSVDSQGFGPGGWSARAVNHAAEPLTTIWLDALEMLHSGKRATPGEPAYQQVLHALSSIVTDTSEFGAACASVLALRCAFLQSKEGEWTRRKLLPLFKAGESPPERALLHEAVWDGFLVQNRLDPALAEALKPAFLEAVLEIREFPDWKREEFVGYCVRMMVYFSADPLGEWVEPLFRHFGERDRHQFALAIGHNLLQVSSETACEWWRRWLREYWENRIEGVPVPLDGAETAAMLAWPPRLPFVLDEAVDVAVRMPLVDAPLPRTGLGSSGWKAAAADHASSMAKLVLRLDEFGLDAIDSYAMSEALSDLLEAELPEVTRHRLTEVAVRRGVVK